MNSNARPSPQISIILCTYHGAEYINEAVKSVVGQTFTNWELQIVEDGSKDDTAKIVHEWAQRDSRIFVDTNEVNQGVGFSYLKGLKSSRGTYIAQIGQDDRWRPDFLQTAIDYMAENPEMSAAFCDVHIIDRLGNPSGVKNSFHFEWLANQSQEEQVLRFMRCNFVCSAGSIFRKSLTANWSTVGNNDQLQDWNTWLHLITQGPFGFIPTRLVDYRIHGGNLSLHIANPTLVKLDEIHSRTQFLLSKNLRQFIQSRPNPSEFFEKLVACYLQFMDVKQESHWQLLFYFVRSNEIIFGESPYIKSILGLLFWRAGAFSKAARYLIPGTSLGLPVSQRAIFRSKWVIAWLPKVDQASSLWVKHYRLGPISVVRLLAPRMRTKNSPTFGGHQSVDSLDRFLEVQLSKNTLPRRLINRILGAG
jgi:glycosyltransferase involved in cell wall biosynthesis